MIRFLLLLAIILPVCSVAQYKGGQQDGVAQQTITSKNALPKIYLGGSGSGYSTGALLKGNQLPSIYTGGTEDGISSATITTQNPGANIYMGGDEDGVASVISLFQNGSDSIYRGGDEDGVSSLSNPAQNLIPSIYLGGGEDGVANNLVLKNNALPEIYKGGIQDGYSIYAKISKQNPLPLMPGAVLVFNGKWSGSDALLDWSTSTNTAIEHFELERSDDGGATYKKISELLVYSGVESKSITTAYSYTDLGAYNLPADFFLYRLKSVGADGKTAYSAIVRLAKDKTAPVLVVYPNPNSGRFTLSVSNVLSGFKGFEYAVTTADGRVVQKGIILDSHTSFDLSNKAAGAYFLSVIRDGKPIQNFTIIIAY